VYLAEPDGQTVFARDLHTGQTKWRLPITELPMFTRDVGHGMAAVVTHTPVPGGQTVDATLALVDEASGQVRRRLPGSVVALTTGPGYLMGIATRDTGCEDMFRDGCAELFALDVATGAEVWRVSFAPHTYYLRSETGDRIDSFAEISEDGRVRIHSAETGAVEDEITLPVDPRDTQLLLLSDRLLAAAFGDRDIEVTAYRRGPLTREWSATVPLAGHVDGYEGWFYLGYCGDVACLHFGGGGTRLVDLFDGTLGPMVPSEVGSLLGGHLLVGVGTGSLQNRGSQQVRIIDPADGQAIAFLPERAELVEWSDSGGRLMVSDPGTNRTGFVLVERNGRQRLVGSVPGIGLTCQATVDVLVCGDAGGHLRAWRLPV
jgi:hypothetical protein